MRQESHSVKLLRDFDHVNGDTKLRASGGSRGEDPSLAAPKVVGGESSVSIVDSGR